MRKSNIGVYLNTLKSEGMLALMRNVVAKMTGNAFFATPAVKLVDLTAKADALEVAIEAATYGSRSSKLRATSYCGRVAPCSPCRRTMCGLRAKGMR